MLIREVAASLGIEEDAYQEMLDKLVADPKLSNHLNRHINMQRTHERQLTDDDLDPTLIEENAQHFQQHHLRGWQDVAKHLRMSVKELKTINPSLEYWDKKAEEAVIASRR